MMESLKPKSSITGAASNEMTGESVYFTAKSDDSNFRKIALERSIATKTSDSECAVAVVEGKSKQLSSPFVKNPSVDSKNKETTFKFNPARNSEDSLVNVISPSCTSAAVISVNIDSNPQLIEATAVTDALLTSTPALQMINSDNDVIIPAVREAIATPSKRKREPMRRFSRVVPQILITPASPRNSPARIKRKLSLLSCTSQRPSLTNKQPRSGITRRISSIDYAISSDEVEELDLTTHTLGEVVDIRGALTLSYHDITMDVRLIPKFKDAVGYFCYRAKTPERDPRLNTDTGIKKILSGVSGIFHHGINAIMGPSGSGKTTLLEILAGRKTNFVGRVMVNGQPIAHKFCQKTGYAPQEDILNPGLTVREHIWYSLCLRRSGALTETEKCLLLGEIISSLDLLRCADTKVGDASSHTISGGERKRTAVAMELASAPKIIFLDEPTSKLDSSTSKTLMHLLKKISDNGRTIILTIHQPSYAIYKLFDRLTLVAKGRTIYHGPTKEALQHFACLGFVCEEHNSPPDFFLDVLYGVHSPKAPTPRLTFSRPVCTSPSLRRSIFQRTINNNESARMTPSAPGEHYLNDSVFCSLTSFNTSRRQTIAHPPSYSCELDITTKEGLKAHADLVSHLADAFVISEQNSQNRNALTEIETLTKRTLLGRQHQDSFKMHQSDKNLNFGAEYSLLTGRAMKSSIKIFFVLTIMNAVIGLIFGILYFHNDVEHPSVQNRLGMFFYLSVHGVMVPAMITAKSFAVNEKALFRHERKGGHYRASTYCLSRCTLVLLARILSAVVFSCFVYWLTGLNHSLSHFLSFLLTAFCSGLACDGVCLYSALAFRSFSTGRLFVVLYMTLTSVFAGFLLDINEAFPWLAWVKYISVTRYCYLGWVINEFIDKELEPCPRMVSEPRRRHAIMIKARLTSAMEPRNWKNHVNITSCTYFPSDSILPTVVGDDLIFLDHTYLTDVILALMASILFVACFFRMRNM